MKVQQLGKIVRNNFAQQIVFWTISYYILLNVFTSTSQTLPIDYLYTAIFMTTIMLPVYFNLLVLIPHFLEKRKYWMYTILVAVACIAGTAFNQLLFDKLIDFVLPGYYFISYYEFRDLLKFFVTFIIVTLLLKLSKEWITLNETKERVITLEKEKLQAELRALMNQVNPHFLFNSLTVLYSLALRKAAETPEAIIKLSDILRYVIYESNAEFVPVRSEVKIIEDYIHLQQYRVGEHAAIDLETSITDNVPIAPMVLLQLVENSFKHGIKGDIENTFIRMKLYANENEINFLIENNRGQGEEIEKNPVKGIGLNNIRERVRLMYSDRGVFRVEEEEHIFRVTLTIQLKDVNLKPVSLR
jgi:sensor histidine kinase YesM